MLTLLLNQGWDPVTGLGTPKLCILVSYLDVYVTH